MAHQQPQPIPPSYDVRRVAKTHFMIFARQFVEQFADYFEECMEIQQVKLMFLAAFGDVPTGLDPENYSELLYKFSEHGDTMVTKMLHNFGTFIKPYKPYLEKRDPAVWAILCALPEAQDNLIQKLDIAGKWNECDPETQEVIWEYVETLVYYGSMFTTYSAIPDSMMSSLSECAMSVIQEKAAAGMPLTEENVQASLKDIAPKIMASMNQEDVMAFGMKMLQNPSMMQDLMGMARNLNSVMPGLNTPNIMQNMMPGGMEGVQQMMATISGANGGQLPQISPEQFAQAQQMMTSMMGGGGGGAPSSN